MKKTILLCSVLLALTATVASAAGTSLRWNDCFTDGSTGVANRNFACNVNTGSQTMFGSFQLAADLADVSGNEQVIDIASAGATLPDWWQFKNAGVCRSAALSWGLQAPGANCTDWASLQASGGIGAYNVGLRGANTARVTVASAVADVTPLTGATEFYCFNATIQNTKSTGVGACGGCSTPVCIVFNSVLLTTPIAANNVKISGASNGTDSNFVTWQGGAGVVVNPPTGGTFSGCPAATPTHNTTWGAVKSLYR